MKIVIVGCGKVGQKLVEQLSREEHDITIIDTNTSIVQNLVNEFDVMGVIGSGTDLDTLTEADLKTADLLIAVAGSDELNLMVCLMAKKIGNCQTIARVRKPEYFKSINLIKDDLGLTMVINPEQAAAHEIARILRFPSAIKIDTFAKGRVEILNFAVSEGSILDGLKLMDFSSKIGSSILICGVERGEEAFIPSGNFLIHAGDLISIIAPIGEAGKFFKKIGVRTNRVKDTMIVGGGDTAYYLAKRLLKTGIDVKIIEQSQERCDELFQLLPKATITHGDGTDNKVLVEEGIEKYGAFVSLTNIDEENVLLSLYAKTKTDGKVVTKINRIDYDNVLGDLHLGTTIYPKNITAEYIVRFVRATHNSFGSSIETMHFILDGKAEALEFRIKENSPISNKKLMDLKLKENILIACITRGGKIIIPHGQDSILPGDTVIVVTLKEGFTDISDILK
mgnify:CR=1 FL=1